MRADRASIALLCLALLMPGCKEEAPPVTAAKRFAAAVRARDTQALLEVVDSQTVAYVEAAAERASDQIGGRRSVEPPEMLQVVDVDARTAIVKAELISEAGDAASVRLTGADGTTHEVSLIREDDTWKVSLPTPPSPAGARTPQLSQDPPENPHE